MHYVEHVTVALHIQAVAHIASLNLVLSQLVEMLFIAEEVCAVLSCCMIIGKQLPMLIAAYAVLTCVVDLQGL